MRWITFVVVGVLSTGCAWSADVVRRQVTHSEAITLLADKASVGKPRVEVVTKTGRTVKARLIDAAAGSLRLERTPAVDICTVQHVRLRGAAAKPRRIARGMVLGGLGSLFLIARIASGTESSAIANPTAISSLIGVGGAVGGRVAETGQDVLYILRPVQAGELCSDDSGGLADRPDSLSTLPLLPLPSEQP